MGSSEKSRTLYVLRTSAGPCILQRVSNWLQKLVPKIAHWYSTTASSEKKIHRRAAGGHFGPLIVHGLLETSAAAVQQCSMLDQQCSAMDDILTFILLSMITEGREPVGILYLFPYHQSAKKAKELSRLA